MEKNMVSVSDLKGIADSGGGLILDAKNFTTPDLKAIADHAKGALSQVTIKNLQSLSVPDMKGIAKAGGGRVIFDFT